MIYCFLFSFDPHWALYSVNCAPCDIRFDAVLKLESLSDDFAELRARTGDSFPAHLGLETTHVSLEVPREDEILVVRAHFMQLSPDERRRLYQVYKPDFDLFDYDPNILGDKFT